ncbi:uroporphyrinogen-III synthase [Halomonas sp. McH1-25]|uniref:uroporphyrinogen-III synthase n=1 Tax=unclassified Halomonas TaxID=2609666 RepID=UPI001EF4145F|nr:MULTISPECIES: uroporphyrinogen-III synthase [unclassified Halomonas]MCG7599472.1 uroporphyrinogen-III synthase [Halomonas sp. McH1-25]MCP1342859.1 uroporphyrinogen-III synthase [Halomonas sp. FL8]MCP1361956.1 uroporphyrinogen-III synthase [Halomonas sp. BBD45]MCP1366112.1 uroporphyrinogen-III synthase [Halomonas sp. BBD48]
MASTPRVLITRPGKRAQPLRQALEAMGVEALPVEALRLEALPESPETRQAWLDFDLFQRVVVISPFAAECLAAGIDRYWPQLPQGPSFYAVGAGTAKVLHETLGVRVHLPPADTVDNSSEALLRLPSLQRLNEQRVLLVAGEGGRTMLADSLAQRGARLTRLALYRRTPVEPDGPGAQYLKQGDFSALVVTSGELLEHLAGWCPAKALNQPLIVSSQRLATLAHTLGYLRLHVAQGATPAALAAAVADACNLDGADHDDLEKG